MDALAFEEYSDEIYQNLKSKEHLYLPNPHYIEETQSKMKIPHRLMIIGWIKEVHNTLSLDNDTLFLSVYLFDRYMSIQPNVNRDKFQLIAITCMFIASKYEEVVKVPISNFESICINTESDIKAMEVIILQTLNYDITQAYSNTFVGIFANKMNLGASLTKKAFAYADIALSDYDLIQYKPSLIAAASIYLALNAFLPAEFIRVVPYSIREIQPVLNKLEEFVKTQRV